MRKGKRMLCPCRMQGGSRNHNGRTYACFYRSEHAIAIVHKGHFFANGAVRQTVKTLR
jgi:hypothetical protein